MSAAPRSILITGAGNGIGATTARLFLARGWRVGVYDLDGDAAEAVAADHPLAVAGVLDVRDPDAWARALAEFAGEHGLDALVNNAGVLVAGPLAELTPAQQRMQVEVNLIGSILGAAAALPHLRRGRDPVLLNVGSVSAFYGQPNLGVYAATKAGIRSLTEGLDLEWAAHGVRVRSVMPLWVSTGMLDDAAGTSALEKVPTRLAPTEVAETILRAVSGSGLGERVSFRSPHRVVGRRTKVEAGIRAFLPDWALRLRVRSLTV